MPDRPRLVVGNGNRGLMLDLQSQIGEVAERVHEILNVPFGLSVDLSGVEGLDLRDDLLSLLDRVGQSMQQDAAVVGR